MLDNLSIQLNHQKDYNVNVFQVYVKILYLLLQIIHEIEK